MPDNGKKKEVTSLAYNIILYHLIIYEKCVKHVK